MRRPARSDRAGRRHLINQRRRPRIKLHLKFRSRSQLHDIAPDQYGIMRWPNGDVWIPEPQPSRTTGLFGRARRIDWHNHTIAADSQVRALARQTQHPQLELHRALISRAQADAWAGGALTDTQIQRLADCIPHSSIPDAIATIVDSWHD